MRLALDGYGEASDLGETLLGWFRQGFLATTFVAGNDKDEWQRVGHSSGERQEDIRPTPSRAYVLGLGVAGDRR